MNIKYKWLAISEFIAILLLLSFIVINNTVVIDKTPQSHEPKISLLSLRVYSGLLEPKSLLIVNFNPLKEAMADYFTKNNITASVYVVNLRDGASFGIDERKGFWPASLNKVPLAMMIMRKIEKKELSFDTMLEVRDSDRTNNFGDLYKTKEKQLSLRFVLEKMLKESDNTAFRILLRQLNKEDMSFFLNYLGYHTTDVELHQQNTSEDIAELVTPRSMYNVFSSLYLSTLLNPQDSEYILSLLTKTVFDINKIAGLPDNVVVAQKFGSEYTGDKKYFHSCGIMYINDGRIFYCIMTKDLETEKAIKTIGYAVNMIHKYFVDVRMELDSYK